MSFIVALALSLVLMPLARWLGLRAGLVDRPQDGGLKIHRSPISILGGPAAVTSILVATAVVRDARPAIVVAVALATAIGLMDDVKSLPPWLRIAVIGGAGAIAAQALSFPGYALGRTLFGAFICIACTNAVNIVDGQDGLAAGLAVIAAISMVASGEILGAGSGLSLGLATAGGLVAFLMWNRPPARLFLGNGGAYGVGLVLAIQAVTLAGAGPDGFVAAALCLGFFVFELLLTTLRRLVDRASLVIGDRQHSYDVLSHRWRSRPRATLALWGAGAATGVVGLATPAIPQPVGFLILALWGLLAVEAGRVLWRSPAPVEDWDVGSARRIDPPITRRRDDRPDDEGAAPSR